VYRLVAFDLDGTLADSRSEVPQPVRSALLQLCATRPVCVVSGADMSQFRECLLDPIGSVANLERLHILALNGSVEAEWSSGRWNEQVKAGLTASQRTAICQAIEMEARRLDLWEHDDAVNGIRLDDRGTQVTFSALGQGAAMEVKRSWDPTGARREPLRKALQQRFPECSVRLTGATSMDVNSRGVDKGAALADLLRRLSIGKSDVIFAGDRLYPGGNDEPVRRAGIPCVSVAHWRETLLVMNQIVAGASIQCVIDAEAPTPETRGLSEP